MVCVALVASCSSQSKAPTAQPLTDDQASKLANVLFDNLDSKGATFGLAARFSDGSTINLSGEVDWAGHFGHAVVTASGAEADLAEVYWSANEVLERRPGLNRQLQAENVQAAGYLVRAPQPAGRDLDRLLGIITALAGPQRDNPLLIKQKAGSAFLRSDVLGGVKVDVLRFGDHNVYSLDQQTGAFRGHRRSRRAARRRRHLEARPAEDRRSSGQRSGPSVDDRRQVSVSTAMK
jgi:hypothetical protein